MRTYTAAERAEAIGLALSIGPKRAGAQLGIPVRTVSHWRRGERHPEQAAVIRADSEEAIAARLWEAVSAGTDAVLEGLRDPKARLSDKAQALRVVAEQWQLITGRATARTESTNLTATLDAFMDTLSPGEQAQARDLMALTQGLVRVIPEDQADALRDAVDDELAKRTLAELQTADPLALDRQSLVALIQRIERAIAAKEAGRG